MNMSLLLVVCTDLNAAQIALKEAFQGVAISDPAKPRLQPTGQNRGRVEARPGVWVDFKIATSEDRMRGVQASDLILIGSVSQYWEDIAMSRVRYPATFDEAEFGPQPIRLWRPRNW